MPSHERPTTMNGRAILPLSFARVCRNATPPSIAVDDSDSRSTTAPTNHGLSASQPLVYARAASSSITPIGLFARRFVIIA